MKKDLNNIIKILKNDGVGVMPTDTLYGLVGSAFSKKAIDRIYKLKKRDKKKKLIVLISSIDDLKKFKIVLNEKEKEVLNKFWPHSIKISRGKPEAVSVILNNIAFRLPKNKKLIDILKKTGPLVAPSANLEGKKPAENIKEAKEYFGDKMDFYLAGGNLRSEPSIIIKLNKKGEVDFIRGTIKK